MTNCPCCSGLAFKDCCAPILDGVPAQTAEAQARARYSAFVVKRLDHVDRTHAQEVKDHFNRAEAERMAEDCAWGRFRVHSQKVFGNEAEIGFVTEVTINEKRIVRGALSRFRRHSGEWLFVSSKPAQHFANFRDSKPGRNDPCVCGSGKKSKKCCGQSGEGQTL